jgi:hypothetical protein
MTYAPFPSSKMDFVVFLRSPLIKFWIAVDAYPRESKHWKKITGQA